MNRLARNRGLIAFSWYGLPQYAARLIREAIDRFGEDCIVIGSKPSVPVKGMQEALGRPVHWIGAKGPASWEGLGLKVPQIFIQSGWSYSAFSQLGRQVKASGGRVIGLSDANWRGDFRQLALGPLVFRALHRRYFDAMLVPGRQGVRLMRHFGMRPERVRMGMYGADPDLFHGGPPLTERSKTILYVGQFIARKDVLGLTSAFLKFAYTHPGWTLHMCGSGVQHEQIPQDRRIIVEAFVQPEQLAARYRAARFFVLPSLKEAWGLVVHEAALCGCGLILSDAIGSGDDLARPENALRFRAGSESDLGRALSKAAAFDSERLVGAEAKSRELAGQFGPQRFAAEVAELVDEMRRVVARGV